MTGVPAHNGQHILVPRTAVQEAAATLWAYHNDEAEGCDGNCQVMRLARLLQACDGQVPALATSGTISVYVS